MVCGHKALKNFMNKFLRKFLNLVCTILKASVGVDAHYPTIRQHP